jgi:hypothetical protein
VNRKKFENLNTHIQSSFDATTLLYSKGLFEHSVYLGFILIDQLAWLVSNENERTGMYFQNWVEEYFIKFYPDITPLEVWGARNAKLHMNTAEAQANIRKGARKLLFIYDVNESINVNDGNTLNDIYIINGYHFLYVALKKAVESFMVRVNQFDNDELEKLEVRLRKLLEKVPLLPE